MKAGDLLAAAAVGLAVFLAITYAARARRATRMRKRLAPHVPTPEGDGRKRRRAAFEPVFGATERAFGRSRLWRRFEAVLVRADSTLRPSQLAWIMLGSGVVPAAFLVLLGTPALVALLFLVGGMIVPYGIVSSKAIQRRRAFDDQLADLLMTMAASVRVGHTFRQSMQAVVTDGLEPASKEFSRVLIETDVGRPVERALREMAQRLGSRNFDYVINAVTIQREVGGSLATLFDVVSETVRQRQNFTKKVRALTAMGRMSAYVLVALPFVVVAGMTLINRQYVSPLFSTSAGRIMLFLALGGLLLGSVFLKKIVSFRLE